MKLGQLLNAELPRRRVFQLGLIELFLIFAAVTVIAFSRTTKDLLAVINGYGCLGGALAVILLARFSSRKMLVAVAIGALLGGCFGWFARFDYQLTLEYRIQGYEFWSFGYALRVFWWDAVLYGATIGAANGAFTATLFAIICILQANPSHKSG